MTTQDEQQVNNLLLAVGVDRIGEFTQSLQPEEQTAIQAAQNSNTGAASTTSARANKTLAKALATFLRRKGQETIHAR